MIIPTQPLNLKLDESISTLCKVSTDGMKSPCKIEFKYYPNATPFSTYVSTTSKIPEYSDCDAKKVMQKPF